MLTLAKAIIASGALIYGAVNVQPVNTTVVKPETVATTFVFAPNHKAPDTFVRDGSDVEANVEQAAEHFDDFAMQMPVVIGKKLEAVLKHGTKAILMQEAETKAAEEKMIGSLVNGLRSIGDAMAADMVQSAQNTRG